jgi:hypothetical protein
MRRWVAVWSRTAHEHIHRATRDGALLMAVETASDRLAAQVGREGQEQNKAMNERSADIHGGNARRTASKLREVMQQFGFDASESSTEVFVWALAAAAARTQEEVDRSHRSGACLDAISELADHLIEEVGPPVQSREPETQLEAILGLQEQPSLPRNLDLNGLRVRVGVWCAGTHPNLTSLD